ncbi:hypothetical protein N431DRAFT_65065 [Stipitochalara longipes BDJ]|nr:hypothetical protein N431DRAFT_65065 [Stipitochalara longipes BDJ]
MDPLSAIGFAGAVVQFVSFAHEIISIGKEVYRSPTGARQEFTEIGIMLEDLAKLHQSLRSDPVRVSRLARLWRWQDDGKLLDLLECCDSIHKELERILKSLVVRGSDRKWKSLCKAVKLVWNESEINDLERRLCRLQRHIDSRLISEIRSQQDSTMEILQDIAEGSRRLEINRAVDLQIVQREIEQGLNTLGGPLRGVIPELPVFNMVRQWSMDPVAVTGSAGLVSLSEHAHRARAFRAERNIIQRLSFQEMNERQDNIKEAHLETFRWIFSGSETSPSHFVRWLEQGSGIFWISGKPGSGKSTLMKYIYSHPRTTQALTRWAGDTTLVQACFYFWAAGTPFQKSIEGLLRSLLFQILRQCPSLIVAAFPLIVVSPVDHATIHLSTGNLIRAIDSITRSMDLNTKFCLFIDGLDEYEGFNRTIASTINKLSSSPSIKLCIASRPYNVFVNAFGGNFDQMLYVQDYTSSDIQQYVKDILERNPAFVSRTEKDPEGYRQLVQYIRKEANGVFLWVYLVVANILDGMENADRMSDLQRKLKMIPTDLKALFIHILNTVEADYHERQAQMLQIACQTEQPLSLIGYSFLDEVDPDFALTCPAEPISAEEVSYRYECMEKRVVARCKLLLEVVERPDSHPHLPKYVTFLHRTVRDYLREAEAQDILASRLKGPFDPRKRLCDLLLAEIKCIPFTEPSRNVEINYRLISRLLLVAKEVESTSGAPLALHLDSLKATIDHFRGPTFDWWQTNNFRNTLQQPDNNLACFLQLIVRSSLSEYLNWRLHGCSDEVHLSLAQKASLLTSSLYRTDRDLVAVDMRWSAAIVEELLKSGAEPNFPGKEKNNISPWAAFVSSTLRLSRLKRNGSIDLATTNCDIDKEMFLIFEQLILAGADLNIVCNADGAGADGARRPNEQKQILLTIEECIERTVTQENATYLLDLIKRRRKEQQHARLNRLFRWFTWESNAYNSILHQAAPSRRADKSRFGVSKPIFVIILLLLVVVFTRIRGFESIPQIRKYATRFDF